MPNLEQQLKALPEAVQRLLERHHFDAQWFLQRAAQLQRGETDNRVAGTVSAPAAGDVADLPALGSAEHQECVQRGNEALSRGELALVVLAGGMATRMGGVVKALVEALPGRSFLELRLAEQRAISARAGAPLPLWLMTSHATDRDTRAALGERLEDPNIGVFVQCLSLRLNPDASLYLDQNGQPSVHAPGHGDLPDALRASGLLERFLDNGGKTLLVANLDNLGAGVDPALLGWHLKHGDAVSCEVVDKLGSDRGGIPVRHDGRPVVLEEFRLPESFDPATVRVFNTNTFHFDARALHDLSMKFTYFTVNKQVNDAPVVQFERLIGEVTSGLPTRFIRVSRSGASSRFLPVKDFDELAARRDEIAAVARARGTLT